MKTSLICFVYLQCALGFQNFVTLQNRIPTRIVRAQNEKDNYGNDEQKDLLEKAKNLREEAKLLEQELQKDKSSRKSSSIEQQQQQKQKIVISDLDDSLWVFKYRFSSQPKNDVDDDVILPNYSGEMKIRLRGDGYSDQVVADNSDISSPKNKLEIVKVWGWDKEYSNEDGENYLLFSVDFKLPTGEVERYYFQARIETTKSSSTGGEEITLNEGTVTIKKDVAEKTKGRWGFFDVANILTQFRYVGDFIAKPAENQ